MGKMHKFGVLIFILSAFLAFPAWSEDVHTREDVRAAYSDLTIRREISPYLVAPVTSGEYAPGTLSDEVLSDAEAYLEFIRYLAYIENDISLDAIYTLRAQHAAVLLAANDKLSHDPDRAPGMHDGFYQTAHTGAMSSNIAAINWMDNDVLIASLDYFVRDDGEANLSVLGHRRWLLNPYLGKTGFGLANSETGMSYTAMYAHDFSNTPAPWETIKWPSEGAFPADLTSYDIPWSVTLNPEIYSSDLSSVTVSMYEQTRGNVSLSYFAVNTDPYGAGPCIIFMPDLDAIGLADYQQNQVWKVRVNGLLTADGRHTSLEYTVNMVSLYPIDPSAVEVSPRALAMDTGDVCQLTALIIPDWADDVSAVWASDNESVATVDANGLVTAVGEGKCKITATSVNGRSDACTITVTAP